MTLRRQTTRPLLIPAEPNTSDSVEYVGIERSSVVVTSVTIGCVDGAGSIALDAIALDAAHALETLCAHVIIIWRVQGDSVIARLCAMNFIVIHNQS